MGTRDSEQESVVELLRSMAAAPTAQLLSLFLWRGEYRIDDMDDAIAGHDIGLDDESVFNGYEIARFGQCQSVARDCLGIAVFYVFSDNCARYGVEEQKVFDFCRLLAQVF